MIKLIEITFQESKIYLIIIEVINQIVKWVYSIHALKVYG